MAKLVVIMGDNEGKEYLLSEGQFLIGQAASAKIPVRGIAVSREHALLTITGERAVIEDRSRFERTAVNGKPASRDKNNPTVLHSGDRIIVGDDAAIFKFIDDVLAEEQTISPAGKMQPTDRQSPTPVGSQRRGLCWNLILMLDNSGSMAGDSIAVLNRSLPGLVEGLCKEPSLRQSLKFSVVTFGNSTQWTLPPSPLSQQFNLRLEAGGLCVFGEALRLVTEYVVQEIRPTTKGSDSEVFIIVLTDGEATDVWEYECERLQSLCSSNILACAVGPYADRQMLRKVAAKVIAVDNLDANTAKSLFRWVGEWVVERTQRKNRVRIQNPLSPLKA